MNVKDLAGLKVAFKSCQGYYLRALDSELLVGSEFLVDAVDYVGEWERWTIISLDDEFTEFAIRSHHNKHLCARGSQEGSAINQENNIGPWERFRLINQNNLWAIQSIAHGSYVRTNELREIVDLQTCRGSSENYDIEIISQPIEVNDLEYNFQWSEVISEVLTTISTTTLENQRNTSAMLDYVFMEMSPISFNFTQFYGPKIGSTKLFAEIPEGEQTSRKEEWNWTPGTKLTDNINITYRTERSFNPGERATISLLATKRQLRIPWKAMAIYKIDNREIKKSIGGIWEGTVYCKLHTRMN